MNGQSIVPSETLEAMVRRAERTPAGCFVEVGVYRGGSAKALWNIADRQGRTLHLFDTFRGMPFSDAGDSHAVGDFGDTSKEEIRKLIPGANLYPGIFPDTLPAHLDRIAFIHCDVDQYRSTRDVIKHLSPLLVPGGVIWFDDWELPAANRAIREKFPMAWLMDAPAGRVYTVKP